MLPLLVLHHPGQHFVTHELAKQFCLANFFVSKQNCIGIFLQSNLPEGTVNSDAGPVLTGRNKPIAAGGFSGGSDKDNVKKLARLPIWGMAGSNDGGSATGMRKTVERLKAAGNVNVKCTVFDGGHKEGGEGMFSTTVELVEWMLGFSKGK